MKKTIIIIPVYKSLPNKYEETSFKQCMNILHDHPICLVTYKTLDIKYYTCLLQKFRVSFIIEYFNEYYFKNISGYNQLMISKAFYQRFESYKYMLIYQLDAYVFRDELLYWCEKNYDYVGAPWFTRHGCHEFGDTLWRVGNGGFSLRRIQFFIDLLNRKRPVYGRKAIVGKHRLTTTGFSIKRLMLSVLYTLGYKNNIKYFIEQNNKPEDIFYVDLLSNSLIKFNCPSPMEGIKFAFERSPQFLYKLNNRQLPFGCHAWDRYDFKFWKKFIQS